MLRDKIQQCNNLQQLAELASGCTNCSLRVGCRGVVFGKGNPQAQLMFIGEGPGAEEDKQGLPFVGAAGQLLDKIILAGGWQPEQVYIANIVKCRPPGNRTPAYEEAEACRMWLDRQVELINPSIVVLLGSVALQNYISREARITRDRGAWIEKNGMKVMPTFHPAALLRDPSKKRPVWEDIKKVRDEYGTLL